VIGVFQTLSAGNAGHFVPGMTVPTVASSVWRGAVVEVVETDGTVVAASRPFVEVVVEEGDLQATTKNRRIQHRFTMIRAFQERPSNGDQPERSTSGGASVFSYRSNSIFADLLVGGSSNGISIQRQFR
jgi:hypothetical protein